MTSRRVLFRPEAETELLQAREWYEARISGLGVQFAHAVDAAVTLIEEHPEAFAIVDGLYRQCVLRRFPYSLVYRITEHTTVVVAVHHQHRHPDHRRMRSG